MAGETKVSMKLLIDTRENRVLFAEAGKDCVDFLFQILSLPVGTVVRLLQGQEMKGSWFNLYKSMQDLNKNNKDFFLRPVAPVSNAVQIPNTFYKCGRAYCSDNYVSVESTRTCPSCRGKMAKQLTLLAPLGVKVQPPPPQVGGFAKEVVTYMVMDDLVVNPMSTISSITLINKFNVKVSEVWRRRKSSWD